jgi:hypothetical protein
MHDLWNFSPPPAMSSSSEDDDNSDDGEPRKKTTTTVDQSPLSAGAQAQVVNLETPDSAAKKRSLPEKQQHIPSAFDLDVDLYPTKEKTKTKAKRKTKAATKNSLKLQKIMTTNAIKMASLRSE